METRLWVPPRPGGCQSPRSLAGGSGALAKACVSLYPGCRVIVYDTPGVVQMAKRHFSALEDERISFHEGGCLEHCVLRETRGSWRAEETEPVGVQRGFLDRPNTPP